MHVYVFKKGSDCFPMLLPHFAFLPEEYEVFKSFRVSHLLFFLRVMAILVNMKYVVEHHPLGMAWQFAILKSEQL